MYEDSKPTLLPLLATSPKQPVAEEAPAFLANTAKEPGGYSPELRPEATAPNGVILHNHLHRRARGP